MKTTTPFSRQSQTSASVAALGLLAAGVGAVVWVLARFWGANPSPFTSMRLNVPGLPPAER